MKRSILGSIFIAGLVFASPAAAQGNGPRWQGWIGCWNAVSNSVAWDSNNGAPRTMCVAPTPDLNVAEVITLADGKVVSREQIDASGKSRALNAGGCTGTEQARFSSDGRRVFLRSSIDCGGSRTETSALLAITSDGDWIDVRSVASGGAASVRVARFRDTGIPRDLPGEVLDAIGARSLGAEGARIATSAPYGADAIIEASKLVDAGVVEGWIMESGQHFAIDDATLAFLSDAGVPGQITDAMVDVSNPRRDSDDRHYGRTRYVGPYGRGASDAWNQHTGEREIFPQYPVYDPWGYGLGYGYPLGFLPIRNYAITYSYPYGLGFGYGFGYGAGYGRRSITGYYYPPVIVLHQNDGRIVPRGRAVRDGGYSGGRMDVPGSAKAAPSSPSSDAASNASAPKPAKPVNAPSKPAPTSPRTAKPKP